MSHYKEIEPQINWEGSLEDALEAVRAANKANAEAHEAYVESALNPKPQPPKRAKVSEETLNLTSGGQCRRVVYSDGTESFENIAPRNRSRMSDAQRAEYGRLNGFGRNRKNPSIPALGELPD